MIPRFLLCLSALAILSPPVRADVVDEVREGDHTLLDQSAILLGSNLGNASSHNNTNLPIITAGGRMKHAGHLAFDGEDAGKTPPLANLFINYLHHLGTETDEFATGKGTLPGIEVV